ncbi:MAG: hypothetical protein PHE25_03490 [Candidatus Gracilibacteria bacterium]|nr:hypothetical protein [Candidatus Gracilibacteria bacterium]
MTTQVKTQDLAEEKKTQITESDVKEIEQTFAEARDFRSIGEKITAPFDNIVSQSAKVIDSDPIMNVSDELTKMNAEVQTVYSEIINNDGKAMRIVKSIPLLGSLVKTLDKKFDEASFNLKGIEGKIGVIFSGFDTAYTSLNTSVDLQKKFLDGIGENISKVEAYKLFIDKKIVEFKTKIEAETDVVQKEKLSLFLKNVEYFAGNLVVLIGNLKMTEKRLLMRLDAAQKLSLSMNSSRPIFKTLLSTALIETSSQKALDASAKAMEVMGSTIDKMSSELTDKAIESSRKAEEIASKPSLSTTVFVENVTKLKNHFDQIETFRKDLLIQAEAEKATFAEAKTKLEGLKVLNKTSQEELVRELNSGSV